MVREKRVQHLPEKGPETVASVVSWETQMEKPALSAKLFTLSGLTPTFWSFQQTKAALMMSSKGTASYNQALLQTIGSFKVCPYKTSLIPLPLPTLNNTQTKKSYLPNCYMLQLPYCGCFCICWFQSLSVQSQLSYIKITTPPTSLHDC